MTSSTRQPSSSACITLKLSARTRVRWQPRRTRSMSRVMAALMFLVTSPVFALPTGGQPVAGSVVIATPNAQTMNITQATDKAIVNWQSFNIARGESVVIAQPSSGSVILNRVIGGDLTSIFGRLSANGHVFLVNPMGVLFGQGGQVDVQGLVASTLAISDGDFLAGRYVFSNGGNAGSVVNQGTINAGSLAGLIGPQVRNDGVINARMGSVGLAAGDRVSLDFRGDGLVSFAVDQAAVQAQASNSGLIVAEGGSVQMTARAANALLDTVINMDGVVRATSLVERNGRIVLDGGPSGVVSVSGTLDASGRDAGRTGGSITVLGDKIGLFGAASLDVSGHQGGGTALIGGNFQGRGPEQNASVVFVGSDARIDASASAQGNGGTVIFWADQLMRFAGQIAARGGSAGGDGGFVEVSGKAALEYAGFTDTRAPAGRTGTLLLDPTDIEIVNLVGGANNTATGGAFNGPPCGGSTVRCFDASNASATAQIDVDLLESGLAASSVYIHTASTNVGAPNGGRITVTDNVSFNEASNALTLVATTGIAVNATITNSGNAPIHLIAGAGITQGAAGNSVISGGTVTLQAATGITANTGSTPTVAFNNVTSGSVSITGSRSGAGVTFVGSNGNRAVTLSNTGANGAVAFGSTVTGIPTGGASAAATVSNPTQAFSNLAAGALTVTATGTGTITQTGTIGATTASFTTGGAAITLDNAGNDFTGAVTLVNTGANTISIRDANALSLAALTAGGNLIAQSNGQLSQTGPFTVTGTSSFTAGSGAINLTDAANAFTGAVSLNNSGNNNVSLTAAGALQLGTSSVGTGSVAITATGAITQAGGFTQATSAGGATFNAGANAITLTNAGNDFTGAVSLVNSGANNITIRDTNALAVAGLTAGGNLSVQSNGNLTQTGVFTVTGTSSFNAGAGQIVLTQNNQLTGAVTLANTGANDVTLTNTLATSLAASSVGSGVLTVNSTSGAITQTGAITQASGAGAASFNAGANAITLTNTGNDFTGTVSVNNSGANNIAVTDTNAIALGASSVGTGTLGVTAGGHITQSGAVVQAPAAGAATFTVTAASSDVLLGSAANDFNGTINLATAGAGTIRDVALRNINATPAIPTLPGSLRNLTLAFDNAAITLPATTLTSGGALSVTAGGAITQGGALVVPGTSSFTAGTNPITLTDAGNNFTGAVSLSNSGANNVSVVDTNAIVLGASSVGTGTLSVTAGGGISQTGAVVQAASAGAATFTVDTAVSANVDIGSQANNFSGPLTVNTSGGGSINNLSVRNINAGASLAGLPYPPGNDLTIIFNNAPIALPTATVAGNLNVTAGGAITQTGALTVNGGSSFTTGAFPITLADAGNNFVGTVSLTNSGVNNVSIRDSNALALAGGTVGGNLSVQSNGNLTQTGAFTVTGTSSFNAGAGQIVLTQNNQLTGAVTLANTGANDVTLTNTLATSLAASSVGSGALTVNSTSGAITQTGAIAQAAGAGTATFNAGANAITLTQSGNDFTGAVSLNNSGANNVAVTDTNALALAASTLGTGTFNVSAGGHITQTGVISKGTGASVFTVTAANSDILLNTAANNFAGSVGAATGGAGSVRDLALRNVNAGATLGAIPTVGRDLTIQFDSAAVSLPAASVGQNLVVSAGGTITQTGALTVTGTSSFTTGAHAITLTDAGNDFGGAVTLVNSGNNAIAIRDANAIQLAGLTAGGTLNVQSNGPITQSGAFTVTGASTFNAGAGAITLTQANNFTGAVALSNTGANNVSVTDTNAIVLGTSSVGTGTLAVTAGGNITQTGAITQAPGAGAATFTVTAAGSNVLLGVAQANDFSGPLNVTTSGAGTIQDLSVRNVNAGATLAGLATPAGNLTIQFDNAAVALPTTSVAGNLSVTAGGAITQSGAVTVTGTSAFSAGGNPITLTNAGNDFTGAVSLTNTGANNVAVTDTNAIVLGNVGTGSGSLTINAVGISQQGGTSVVQAASAGTATFSGGAGAITLTQAGNDFTGAVSLNNSGANNVALTDSNAVVLGASNVGTGTFGVTAGGAITQTGAVVQAGGAGQATFSAGANAITLTQAGNDFTGAVRLLNSGANNVALTDANAVDLGASTVGTGTLSVTASGAISQSGAIVQGASAGAASFSAGANTITLTNAGNNFTGAVQLSNTGNNAVAVRDSNAIVLGTSSVGGSLDVTAGGNVTQTGVVTSAGTTTVTIDTAANADILLASADNNFAGFSTTTANGGTIRDLAVRNINATATLTGLATPSRDLTIEFVNTAVGLASTGSLTVGRNLSVTAGGPITQTNQLIVTGGTATFNAGGNPIILTNALNDFGGAVTLSNTGANNVSIRDANAISFAAITTGGNLSVQSSGNITQTGPIVVPGTSSFDAGAGQITLTNAANDFTGTVTVANTGANNISVRDTNAIALAPLTTGGNLLVQTDGAITQTGAFTVAGTSTFNADMVPGGATGPITLTQNNALTGVVSLTNAGANDVTLVNTLPTALAASSVGSGALAITSTGAITQTGAVVQSASAGAATFNAGANAITLTNAGNDFTGSVSLNNSGANNVAVRDSNALALGASSFGSGTFGATAGGHITQTGALTQAAGGGTSTFTVTAASSDVLVGSFANNLSGAMSAAVSGGSLRDVTLRNVNAGATLGPIATVAGSLTILFDNAAVALPATSVGQNLAVTAGGAITQTGALTVPGTATFNAAANPITLTNAGNNFTGAVSVNNSGANNVSITDSNAIDLGASNVGSGTLTVNASGAITQSGAVVQQAGATGASFSAGANPITLSNAANDFTGTVTLANTGANNVAIRDANALQLAALNAGGNLAVQSNGALTQTGALVVAGTSSFDSGTGVATLTHAGNAFTGTVAVQSTGAGGASINDSNAIQFAASSAGTSGLTVSSGGAITQSGAIVVSGPTTLVAGTNNVTLDGTGNQFIGTLNITGGQIKVFSDSALSVGTVTTSNNLGMGQSFLLGLPEDRKASVAPQALIDAKPLAAVWLKSGGAMTSSGAPVALNFTGTNRSVVLEAGGNVGAVTPLEVAGGAGYTPDKLIVLHQVPTADRVFLTGVPAITGFEPRGFKLAVGAGEFVYNNGVVVSNQVATIAGETVGSIVAQITDQVEASFKPGAIDQVILFGFQGDLTLAPPPVFGAVRGILMPPVDADDLRRKQKP